MISVRLTDSVGCSVAGRRSDSRATAWTSLRPCHSSRQYRSLPVNKCNRLLGDTPVSPPTARSGPYGISSRASLREVTHRPTSRGAGLAPLRAH